MSGFDGAVVLSLESRHEEDMARLIEKSHGVPVRAPSLREVPLTDQNEALAFAERLIAGECDVLVLTTGVGFNTLFDAMRLTHSLDDLVDALSRCQIACRGPKPVRAIRIHGLKPAVIAPEPNTSATLLGAIERQLPVSGRRVCVQEYGAPTPELTDGLTQLGAHVRTVAVYGWQLPADVEPLRRAAQRLAERSVDVVMFTSAKQIEHLLQMASELGIEEQVRTALDSHTVVCSIGPVTSDALRRLAVVVDTEPDHPKMGHLVQHSSRVWSRLAGHKRASV